MTTIPPLQTNLHDLQLALESESRALGAARYRKQRSAPWVDLFGPNVDEGQLPPGRKILRQFLQATSEEIADFLSAGESGKAGRRHAATNLLKGADPIALAYLTLRCSIQASVHPKAIQKAALAVGRAVQDHLEYAEFDKISPAGASGLQKATNKGIGATARRQRAARAIMANEGASLGWSDKERLQVGIALIDKAVAATGLFEMELVTSRQGKKFRKEQLLGLSASAFEWMERQHERCELLDPIPMPMVVEPRPWTTPFDGGYLTPPIGNALVQSKSRPYLEELANIDMPVVYRAVNAIQGTAWQINRDILQLMDRLWNEGGQLGNLPPRHDLPLPAKPSDFDVNELAKQEWKSAATLIHAENARLKSKRGALAQKLWVARKLVDRDAIYFPHHLDFRGRVYPTPSGGPHPQDSDQGKALLRFSEGKALGSSGVRWLAIHLANLFGVDKVSFEERIAWVSANTDAILDSAANPLDGQRFWTTSDKPWMALAACIEWKGYVESGPEFLSHLPIAVDGSNSGLQHFTALLRDTDAAPHVNLQNGNEPRDLYKVVAERAQAIVDNSDDPQLIPWKDQKITRKITKRPCMTYAYSAKARTMTGQILEELQRLDEEAASAGKAPHLNGADNFLASAALSQLIYKLIGEAVPAAKAAMKWLQAAAKRVNKVDLPLWWTTPAGFPVIQYYPNVAMNRVRVTFRSKTLQLSLSEMHLASIEDSLDPSFTDKSFDGKRVSNAVAANFIHSLDAAHLMLVADRAQREGIVDLAVIHDSFGTHAANMDLLSEIIRETFVELYRSDPLARFDEELREFLGDEARTVPDRPRQGGLDLNHILTSEYMFA